MLVVDDYILLSKGIVIMLLLLLLLCLLNDHTRLVDLADLNQVLIPLENDFLYLRLLLLLMSDALLRVLVDTFLPNKDS